MKEGLRSSQLKYNRHTILEAWTRLREGIAVENVAEELGVDVETVKQWKEKHVLSLSGGNSVKSSNCFDKSIILQACKQLQQGQSA